MKIKGKNVLRLAGEMVGVICIYYAPIACIDYVLIDFVYGYLHMSLQSTLIAVLLGLSADVMYICLIATIGAVLELSKSSESHEEPELKLEVVTSNHGSSLKEVMEAIRNEELEYLAFFDLEGKKLAEGTYLSPDKCNITTEDWHSICHRGEEVMKVHNHPSRSNVAFSAQDFRSFLCQDFIRKTVVVTKDYNFIMEKIGNGYEASQDDAKAYVEKMDIMYSWLSTFSDRLWSIVVARKTAEKFGLQFRVERINQAPTRSFASVGIATCLVLAALCLFKPQCSSADDPAYHSNAQILGGQQDNIVTEAQLVNEVFSGYIDPPM